MTGGGTMTVGGGWMTTGGLGAGVNDRSIFARGAIDAALWLQGGRVSGVRKTGQFSIQDVLGESG